MKSVYIHIPFCQNICSYCDFAKVYYFSNWVTSYLETLKKEIIKTYQGEKIKTIYIGGGTPSSLSIEELTKLFSIINLFDKSNLEEFTIEINVENINNEKLALFKKHEVNRLSLGVQTFNDKHLSFLNRKYSTDDVIKVIKETKKIGFNNISVDLIYGIPNQTIKDLKKDLEILTKLDIEHISTYLLSIEQNTKLYIDNNSEVEDEISHEMYYYINEFLVKKGFVHYEISNYAKKEKKSKHNLVYWNNEEYYGFGLGASSFIDNKRYENTKSFNDYIKGKYILNTNQLSNKELMENEMILGLRKIEGLNQKHFFNKYKVKMKEQFNIESLIVSGDLVEEGDYLFIPKHKLFLSNEILINFID